MGGAGRLRVSSDASEQKAAWGGIASPRDPSCRNPERIKPMGDSIFRLSASRRARTCALQTPDALACPCCSWHQKTRLSASFPPTSIHRKFATRSTNMVAHENELIPTFYSARFSIRLGDKIENP